MFSSILKGVASVGKGILGAAKSYVTGNMLGDLGSAGIQYMGSRYGTREGAAIDRKSARDQLRDRWSFMEGKGLTNTEIAGSGAPGSSAVQGSQATLGNSAAQIAQQMAQRRYDAQQRDLDRQVDMRGQDAQIQSSAISAQGSIQSSSISAAAMNYAATISKQIADGQLKLQTREFEEATLKQVEANIGLTEAQSKKVLNEALTADPEFVRTHQLLTMAPPNLVATLQAAFSGVDLNNLEELQKLPLEKQYAMLQTILAVSSTAMREATGTAFVADSVMSGKEPDTFFKLMQFLVEGGPPPNAPMQKTNTLGRPHERRPN